VEDFQVREEHWVIADLIGKGKHIRTVPVPGWANRVVDKWTMQLDKARCNLSAGKLDGKYPGRGLTRPPVSPIFKVIWDAYLALRRGF
jgi:hypothetical protein